MQAARRAEALARGASQIALQRPDLAALEARMKEDRARSAVRAGLLAGAPEWGLLLKDLSLRIGPGVRLSEVRPEEVKPAADAPPGTLPTHRLVLQGELGADAAQPELTLAGTLKALMASGFFGDVRLLESTAGTDGTTHFSIALAMRGMS